MEVLIPLAICLFLVVLPVLTIIAFLRTNKIAQLENQVVDLRDELRAVRRAQVQPPQPREETQANVATVSPPEKDKDERLSAAETVLALSKVSPPEPVKRVFSLGPVFLRPRVSEAPEKEVAHEAVEPEVARKNSVDWEWILGVRGAAVLGGIVLALAAVLFFRHAFVHNWIKPPLRIGMGAAAGLALIGAGARLRKSAYMWVPGALQGAGIVALYATVFSAFRQYQYLSWASALPLMALITAAAVALALVHNSLIVAQLGLIGGFITPLLLDCVEDHPLSTFGYIMLLNLALLAAGRRRKWTSLGNVALVATFIIEALWIFGSMQSWGRNGPLVGLGVAAVFGVLFLGAALTAPRGDKREQLAQIPFQIGAALVPFLFGAYFASQVDLGGKLWPLLALLIPASLGTLFVGAARSFRGLSMGGVLAPVGIVLMWFMDERRSSDADAWQVLAVAAMLGVTVALFAEWGRSGGLERLLQRFHLPRSEEADPGLFAVVSAGSSAAWLVALVVFALLPSVENEPLFLPRLLGLGLFALLLFRHSVRFANGPMLPFGSIGLSIGFLGFYLVNWNPISDAGHEVWGILALGSAIAAAYLAVGHFVKRPWSPWATWAASGFIAVQAAALPFGDFDIEQFPWALFWAIPVYLCLQLVASVNLKSQLLFVLALVSALWMELAWTSRLGSTFHEAHPWMIVPQLLIVVLVVTCPILMSRGLGASVLVRRAAALAPLLFTPFIGASLSKWDSVWHGSIALWVLSWVALMGAAWQLHADRDAAQSTSTNQPVRKGVVWSAWTAAILLASATTVAIDVERVFVLFSLLGLGFAVASYKLEHRGLAWWSAASVLVAGFKGLDLAIQESSFEANSSLFLHEFSALYLALVAICIAMFVLLKKTAAYTKLPRPANFPAIVAGVSLFLWMNLEIANHFATGLYTGPFLRLSTQSLPARDVTTSVAWGVFAIGLLSLGSFGREQASRAKAPRWASLGLFALAIGKVFLFDLRHLEGLWRVASLVGLALALITLSLFYQRFVFRKDSPVVTA